MATAIRAIRSKIRSVGNIKKITKAMEMVSASKMRKAVSRALAGREYINRLAELASRITLDEAPRAAIAGRTLVVLIQTNKGLCGGFNLANGKAALQVCREIGTDSVDFVTIGRSAENFARTLGRDIKASFASLPEDISITDVYPLSQLLLGEFQAGEYQQVLCVYNSFISALSYQSTVK
ncbi:MAG TPA: FoF1 ATP synthase subunit gamma, partial [Candidatus Paceibacterota bacterium]|nr:FoF1 ATP synthase subunit gamma [Candidatus Paceibacterota bacterium]